MKTYALIAITTIGFLFTSCSTDELELQEKNSQTLNSISQDFSFVSREDSGEEEETTTTNTDTTEETDPVKTKGKD